MSQPWIPPVSFNWNNVTQLLRTATDHDLTIPEEDQNKNDVDNAINWLGQQLCAILPLAANNFGWYTGFVMPNIRSTIPSGWLNCDYTTLGNGSSGADHTGIDYQPLFNFMWASDDATLLDSSGFPTTKGANQLADWNDNKRIYLPDISGRAIIASGHGSGLTSRLLGDKFGAEYYADSRTYSISGIAVSGSTPTIIATVSNPDLIISGTPAVTFSSMGSVVFPTYDYGTLATLPTLIGSFPVWVAGSSGTLPSLTGAFPTWGAGSLPTLVTSGGGTDVNINTFTPSGTITNQSCLKVTGGTEPGNDVLACATLAFAGDPITPTIDKTNILAALTFSQGVLPTLTGSWPVWNAGSADTLPTLTGSWPVWSAGSNGTLPSQATAGDNNVSGIVATVDMSSATIGGSITIPPTTLTGVTASGTTQSNPVNIPTLPPSYVLNFMIKI